MFGTMAERPSPHHQPKTATQKGKTRHIERHVLHFSDFKKSPPPEGRSAKGANLDYTSRR